MTTSIRPLDDWGKLPGDVPTATAILDQFLHHAELVQMNGRSYRLPDQQGPSADAPADLRPAKAPTESEGSRPGSTPAKAPTGSDGPSGEAV